MIKKAKLLKNFLTTASIIGIVSVSNSALADNKDTAAEVVYTKMDADFAPNTGLVDNDDIAIDPTKKTKQIIFDKAALKEIGSTDLKGSLIDVDIEINENLIIGAVSTSVPSINAFNYKIANTKKLTLSGKKGIFAPDKYNKVKSFDFGTGSSELIINAASGKVITLDAKFINPDHGKLTLKTNLISTDGDIGNIKLIDVANNKNLAINPANDSTVNILGNNPGDANSGIKLDNISNLNLTSSKGTNNSFVLKNDFDPGASTDGKRGRGRIRLHAAGDNGAGKDSSLILTVNNANAPKSLGTANKIRILTISGDKPVIIERGVNVNSIRLNVFKGAILVARDQSLIDQVGNINIGVAPGAITPGPGTYIFDGGQIVKAKSIAAGGGVGKGDTTITVPVANIKFNNADSVLGLGGKLGTVDTLTLQLDGDITAYNTGGGIIKLGTSYLGKNSKDGSKVVLTSDDTITPKIRKLGDSGGDKIKELNISATNAAPVVVTRFIDLSGALKINVESGQFTAQTDTINNVPEINIGTTATPATYAFDGGQIVKAKSEKAGGDPGDGDETITISAANIKFGNADSELSLGGILKTPDTLTLKLNDNITAFAGDGGIINLGTKVSATEFSVDGSSVILTSDTGDLRTLGNIGGDRIKELNISATNKAQMIVTNEIDLDGVLKVNVKRGQLVVETATIGNVPEINIGTKGNDGAGIIAEDGILNVDATLGNMKLLKGAQVISFNTPNSRITFTSDDDKNDTEVKIFKDIKPTAGIVDDDDGVGIVEFRSDGTGKTLSLISKDNNKIVGLAVDKRINQFIVSGREPGEVDVEIYAKSILIGEDGNNIKYDPIAKTGDRIGQTTFKKVVDLGKEGSLIFNNPGYIEFEEDVSIGILDFKEAKDPNTTSLTIADTKTLLINDNSAKDLVLNNQIEFAGPDSTLKILKDDNSTAKSKNIILEKSLEYTNPDEGIIQIEVDKDNAVEFSTTSNASLGVDTHKFKSIELSGAGTHIFGVNAYSNDFILDKTNFAISKDVQLKSNLKVKDSDIDLQGNTLKYVGDAKFEGENTISTSYIAGKGDNITLDAASKIDLGSSNLLTILFSSDNSATKDSSYDVIEAANSGQIIGNPANGIEFNVIRNDSRNINWELNGLTISAVDLSDNVLKDDLAEENPRLGEDMANNLANARQKLSDGKELTDFDKQTLAVSEIANTSGDKVKELSQRQATNSITSEATSRIVNESVNANTDAILNIINSRTNNNSDNLSEANSVAAGDESLKHGIWISPFYNQSVQKKLSITPGYKTKATGGTVGLDGRLDNLTAGLSLTTFRTNITQEDNRKGDYAKVDTNMVSLYASNKMLDNFYVQAVAFFSTSTIKNNEQRVLNLTTNQIATSKYKSTSFGGQALGGYNHKVRDNAMLDFLGGLGYSLTKDNSYSETGTSFQNFKVNKKSINKVKAILGAKGIIETNLSNILVRSELYSYLNYNLNSKAPKIEARQDGNPSIIKSNASKPTRAFYTFGGDLSTSYRMMDYGFKYAVTLGKKYVGQNVALRVKANF